MFDIVAERWRNPVKTWPKNIIRIRPSNAKATQVPKSGSRGRRVCQSVTC